MLSPLSEIHFIRRRESRENACGPRKWVLFYIKTTPHSLNARSRDTKSIIGSRVLPSGGEGGGGDKIATSHGCRTGMEFWKDESSDFFVDCILLYFTVPITNYEYDNKNYQQGHLVRNLSKHYSACLLVHAER